MTNIKQTSIIILILFLMPVLIFIAPRWLSLFGIHPSWPILWLLPWSIESGAFAAIFAGLLLGLIVDGITIGLGSQIPVLMLLGFWWSRLGRKGSLTKNSLSFGLLAWIGSFCFGLSIWLQTIVFETSHQSFYTWGFKTLIAQSLLTAAFAPLISPWLAKLFRKSSI